MAARLNKRHSDMVRSKIQATQIINRLQNHIDGIIDLSSTQVRSAEILLNKSVPNLQSVTHDVEQGSGLADILKDIAGTSSGLPEPVDESRAVH